VENVLKLPDELRRAVAADLSPVKPLASPSRRALAAAAWVPLAALLVLAVLGLRHDAALLGGFLTWGTTFLEAALGLVLVVLALAAAVPGGGASRERTAIALAVTALALGNQAWLTRAASAGATVPDPWIGKGPVCFALTMLLGLSALAIVAALIFRAAPQRAALACLLGGAGAGLMADGVYHLHCWVTDLRHVLLWHGGAFVALTLVALAAGLAWERRESARMAARLSR
jgi:hypothetical protein